MALLLVFAVVLLIAVLLSELESRSVLSISVLFLAAGLATGETGFGWLQADPEDPLVSRLVELALFSVLFTDGMKICLSKLLQAWRLPGRALLLGMPMTVAATAVLAAVLAGCSWLQALLLGAVLAPTDPVIVRAIVGREDVPQGLRDLLSVESGVNDGIALPLVVGLLAMAWGDDPHALTLLGEVAAGVGIGIAVPWVVLWLENRSFFRAHQVYEPLLGFTIALLVYAIAVLVHANEFLAAFAAGVTTASISERASREFERFGAILAELLKLLSLLLFGVLITPSILAGFTLGEWSFAIAVLVLARPVPVLIALIGSSLGWRERGAAAWFGPKGFASVAYALLILRSGLRDGVHLFHLVAIVIALSIVAHSSTDWLVAQWLVRKANGGAARESTQRA